MGFHNRPITKGTYGELSKVREELEEAEDAEAQGQKLILLTELADILGAVEGVAKKYGFTLDQLRAYSAKRSQIAVASLELTGASPPMVRSTALLCAVVAVLVQGCADPCPIRRQEGCREVTTNTVIPIVAGKIITVTVVPVRRTVCDVDICVSPTKR